MSEATGTSKNKAHILIIEDEEGLRFMLETKLFQLGYNVTVAATGRHALQKLRAGQEFDLIISDLKMPGMSGIDLFREYKSDGGQIPYVLLTGFPDRAKIVEAIQLGVRDVLLKPIRQAELVQRIETFVSEGAAALGRRVSVA